MLAKALGISKISILPIRDGNLAPIRKTNLFLIISILPIRDGNAIFWLVCIVSDLISILPIRDGNKVCGADTRGQRHNFDTSYKGWKLEVK